MQQTDTFLIPVNGKISNPELKGDGDDSKPESAGILTRPRLSFAVTAHLSSIVDELPQADALCSPTRLPGRVALALFHQYPCGATRSLRPEFQGVLKSYE